MVVDVTTVVVDVTTVVVDVATVVVDVATVVVDVATVVVDVATVVVDVATVVVDVATVVVDVTTVVVDVAIVVVDESRAHLPQLGSHSSPVAAEGARSTGRQRAQTAPLHYIQLLCLWLVADHHGDGVGLSAISTSFRRTVSLLPSGLT